MPPALPSYASGTADVPLLGDTIGDDLDRTAARRPDGEALVEVATGRRWTYAEFVAQVDALALGLLGAGVRTGRPGGDLGAERRGVGVRPVRDRQDRRDPGQHQPGLPHARAGVRAQPVRHRGARRRPQLQDLRLRRDDRGGPAPLRRAAAGGAARLARRGTRWRRPSRRPRRAGAGAGVAEPGRPDQHPVHVRHHGLPEGRHAQPPQHPQQRVLRRAASAATPRRTGSASPCPSTTASAW